MLLRRVIQHFRNQEWTAVAIDFVIVVVGVYIGIQAQNWSNERENRIIEKQYLERLHDEVAKLIKDDELRVEQMEEQFVLLKEVTTWLANPQKNQPLNDDHCDAIGWSHIYVARAYVPPTIQELLSTGNLQLIQNAALRLQLVTFSQTIETYHQLVADLQTDRLILTRAHPALIGLDPADEDDTAYCDFDGMSKSAQFINDVTDNRSRARAYVGMAVVGQQRARISLHEALDRELGIEHPGNNPDSETQEDS